MIKLLNNARYECSMKSQEEQIVIKKRLDRLESFIMSGSYVDLKNKDIHLRMFLSPITDVCLRLGIRRSAVSRARKIINDALTLRLGSSFVTRIMEGDVEVDDILDRAEKPVPISSILLSDMISELKSRGLSENNLMSGTVDFKDCRAEMRLLKVFSQSNLKTSLSTIDISKLLYLASLLEETSPNVDDKLKLLDYLVGDYNEQ